MIKKVFSAILFCFYFVLSAYAQQNLAKTAWVDSVFSSLSLNEKIGQLFMVAAYSGGNEQHYQVIDQLVKKHHIGGLIFMQGHPHSQASLTNRYQRHAEVPLLIAQDAEWGLGMRLDSTLSYPKQMTLGAIEEDSLIYQMGAEVARQLKLLGVHINLAPVADINNNPQNPVIGDRSFGEDKKIVSQKAIAYMKGMQDNGIIACAKHFPGHGDTNKDSHVTLPVIKHKDSRLQQVELYPFKKLINAGVKSIMTAHLQVNAYDKKMPSSLSEKITTQLLKEEMGFNGLVISDALNMKAVADDHENVELEALRAGNDILLFSQDVPGAVRSIKKALRRKKISRSQFNSSVKQVLAAKFEAGLHNYVPANTDNVTLKLNRPEAELLRQKLYEKAVTIVKHTDETLPLKVLDNKYFASVNVGGADVFSRYLEKYAYFSHYDAVTIDAEKHKHFDYIIVGMTSIPDSKVLKTLRKLDESTHLIISYFGSPYEMQPLAGFKNLMCTYENDSITQVKAAEVVFGSVGATARLPLGITTEIPAGSGEDTKPIARLSYGIPEAVNMDSRTLKKIDEIAIEAIRDYATPGCQILVARGNQIIFDKAYGHYTYDSLKPVTSQTIYDIASITKVFASMQAFMFLEERGLIDLDKKIAVFLPELRGTNKADMTFRDILTHQAGLWPYLPFWKQTMEDSVHLPAYYFDELNQEYPIQITPNLYGAAFIRDSVWHWVKASKIREKVEREPYDYKYSDMGYYIIQRLVEKLLNQPMEIFLQQNFYDPMGLSTMSYLPLCKYPLTRIAPTEEDNYFRNTLVYGTVHDQGAAMMGGVAGHAGLFSNANDMAKMMFMHLNDGQYGVDRYFKQETLDRFTSRQYVKNRRGLGWDKPLRGFWYGPTSEYASGSTFGHTGFTGTAVWADPEFDLIYVFLSNRIHPDAANAKLIKNNIRTRIQDVIYESIFEYQQTAGNEIKWKLTEK